MKRLDPHTKQSLRAREIHQNVFLKIMVIGCVVLIFSPISIEILLEQIGIPNDAGGLGAGVGIGVVVLMGFAQNRASRALKIAGLIREESETITRTKAVVPGEIIEFRKSIWSKLGGIAIFLGLAVLSWWLWQQRPAEAIYRFVGGTGMCLFSALALLFLINIRRPIFRLDDQGIFVCADWLIPRTVRWERIASAQFQCVWGLPPAFSLDENPIETITLKNEAGKSLLTLNFATFFEAPPEQKQRFIAELKRRLTANH